MVALIEGVAVAVGWKHAGSIVLYLLFVIASAGWGAMALSVVEWAARIGGQHEPSSFTGGARWFVKLVLGHGVLSWSLLLLGLAGLFYQAIAWALVVAGISILLFRTLRGRSAVAGHRNPREKKTAPERLSVLLLALIGISHLIYTLAAHTFLPPHEWDEVAYHLALPKLYMEAHRITYVPFIVHSNWPMNTEMLFSLGLLLGSETLPHLITWGMSLLGAWGVYLVGRRYLDDLAGVVAAVLFLSTPLVLRLSGTGYIDVSLIFYGAAALFSYANYRKTTLPAWVILTGLFAGMAAGSKLPGGAYPLFLGLLLLGHGRTLSGRQFLRHVSLFVAAALLVAVPWYARSYFFTGNPVWPFFYDWFGGRDWDALGDLYHTQSLMTLWAAEIPVTLRGLLQSLYYQFARPELLGFGGGLGRSSLLLFATAPLALLAKRRVPKFVFDFLFFVAGFYLIWFTFLGHQSRFLLPILPALVLVAAFSFAAFWELLARYRLQLLLTFVLVIGLLVESPWSDTESRDFVRQRSAVAAGVVPAEDFLAERIAVLPAFEYINEHLPEDVKVLLLPYENRAYYLDRPYIWGNLISQRVIPFEQFDTPEALVSFLQRMGVTHILDSPTWVATDLRHWEHDRALMLAAEEQCADRIASWPGDIHLYRLTACRTGD